MSTNQSVADAFASPAAMNRKARRAAGIKNANRAGFAAASFVLAGTMIVPLANALPSDPGAGLPGSSQALPSSPAPAVPQTAPSNRGPGVVPDPPGTVWRTNPNIQKAPPSYTPIYNPPANPAPAFLPPPPRPMILPEPGMIRVGKYQTVKPPWVTMAEMNSVNRWAAYAESQIAQYWISQGFSEDEADRRAASMIVGGVVGGGLGGAIGFGIGVLPGALVGGVAGAAIGGLAGLAAGGAAAGGCYLSTMCIWAPWATGAIIAGGVVAGALAGGLVGGVIGGTITGLAIGIPLAVAGASIGAILGEGDPNQDVNQRWQYLAGRGEIEAKPNALEFDWNMGKSNAALAGVDEAHWNLQVKDDDTWVVKLGSERWLGATKSERQKYFYDDLNRKIPGAGDAASAFLEDKNGVFQKSVRDFLGDTAKRDRNAQYNPDGSIKDPSKRAERVAYGYTSTPDRWDEPRYTDEDNPRADSAGSGEAGVVINQDDPLASRVTPNVSPAPAVASMQVTPQQAPAPVQLPPIPQTGNKQVDKAVSDGAKALSGMIPGIPGA
jgi:hypothetical protein